MFNEVDDDCINNLSVKKLKKTKHIWWLILAIAKILEIIFHYIVFHYIIKLEQTMRKIIFYLFFFNLMKHLINEKEFSDNNIKSDIECLLIINRPLSLER